MTVRVRFVAHDASPTGVPTLLLRTVEALAARGPVQPEVLLLRGGPLAEPLAQVAPTAVVDRGDGRGPVDLVATALTELGAPALADGLDRARLGVRARPLAPPHVVVLYGAAAHAVLRHADRGDAPVVGYLHEQGEALGRALARRDAPLLAVPDHHLAVTGGVADDLVARTGIDRASVEVVGGFVPDEPPPTVEARPVLRRRLGVPDGVPLVVAMGALIPRKGPDLFLQAALRLRAAGRAAHLVWVGPGRPDAEAALRRDLRACGLDERVHLVGLAQHPYDWLRAADVFVVASREDPLPLVALEAAQVRTPIVATAAGGLVDLLGEGARGLVVPPLDADALAAAVAGVVDRPGEAARRAAAAAEWVAARHARSTVVPTLEALLVSFGEGGPRGHRYRGRS